MLPACRCRQTSTELCGQMALSRSCQGMMPTTTAGVAHVLQLHSNCAVFALELANVHRSMPLSTRFTKQFEEVQYRLPLSGERSLHWSDLHQMLLKALPEGIVHFGTMVTSVEQAEGSSKVQVRAERKAQQGPADATEGISTEADLVIAADGSMSNTRQKFVPSVSRRQAPCPGSQYGPPTL